ncbi:MAG TPA: DUF3298 domain-containing protein [Acetivibrio sp.]|uniref:DUF3298 and DUF4163 domain-containing protein n=1 Tax=Acetivibrio sp. TaxID=1872092 RepID=UPI002BC571CA|nr:DUF3298 domain-containing protein [Acetivibrio sp.]HOM02632.1 DUF3298 domain-containing protein [Acetivibrio sp.]
MKDKNLDFFKKQYLDTPIPDELDIVVKKALKDGRDYRMKRNKLIKRTSVAAALVVASVGLLTVGINSSPAFASTLGKVPIVRGIVKVLTFKEYTVNEDRFKADIKVPSIQGLENKELENSLNEKYLEENKKLYKQFMADMESMKEGEGYLGVDSGYVVKTDTDRILSIGRYFDNIMASSSTVFKYDTIDKEKGILITLPSLFKDDSYVEIISENIKNQMRERMKADDGFIYWVDVDEDEEFIEPFDKISENQNFYITEEGKLVISFDKYEVGPGYMGIQEFEIPTEVISDILVGNEYIK